MPPDENQSIPIWMADLRADMRELQTELRSLGNQIPSISQKLEGMVPMHEHIKLLNDVAELTRRDVGERSSYEEMKAQVPILWDERAQIRGALRFWRGAVVVLTAALTLLSLFVAFHNSGLVFNISHP